MNEINKLEDIKRDYSDIITLKRPISKYKKMSIEARSAQFAPFAALTGYSEEIKETARITDNKIELSEDKKTYINEQLEYIISDITNHPTVIIRHFVKDNKKKGGKYIDYKGSIKRVDTIYKKIIFDDKKVIFITDILDIIRLI